MSDARADFERLTLEHTQFGSQVGADPTQHPRWSEEEGRILRYDEYEERPRFDSDEEA